MPRRIRKVRARNKKKRNIGSREVDEVVGFIVFSQIRMLLGMVRFLRVNKCPHRIR